MKGSLVHRALELLFGERPADRTRAAAQVAFEQAVAELPADWEYLSLGLTPDAHDAFVSDANTLVDAYFRMEDPRSVREIGLELRLEAKVGDLSLRGVIDRLELGPDGELIVSDYKTGRPPMHQREQAKLGGVNFYAFLCQEVLGRRPAKVRLMYLRTGEVIEATPTEQSVRFLTRRTDAVFQAVAKACTTGDFRPRPGGLCSFCGFQSWCPSFGGDPTRAADEAPKRLPVVAA